VVDLMTGLKLTTFTEIARPVPFRNKLGKELESAGMKTITIPKNQWVYC